LPSLKVICPAKAAADEKKELWFINIKQAIQGLFTVGTSVTHCSFSESGHLLKMTGFTAIKGSPAMRLRQLKEKVVSKRGLKHPVP